MKIESTIENFCTIMFTRLNRERKFAPVKVGMKEREREVEGKSFRLIIHEFIIKTLSSVVAFESGYLLGILEKNERYFTIGALLN